MDNNMKAYLTVGLGFFVILILIVTSSFFGRREDPELVAEVQQNAEQYIEENFEEEMIIVDTFHDNADIYDQFYYAAIVEPANDPDFQFLVYKHNETDEYTDSYVAEVWEDELEAFLTPKIEELFGEDSIAELWLSYPKDIGMRLDICYDDIPSLETEDVSVIIRLTLNREKHDEDEETLEKLIDALKNEKNVAGGHITVSFTDNSLIFRDSNLNEEF